MDDEAPELDAAAFAVLHTLAVQPGGMMQAALQNTMTGVESPADLIGSLAELDYISITRAATGNQCTITDAGRARLDAHMRRSGQ